MNKSELKYLCEQQSETLSYLTVSVSKLTTTIHQLWDEIGEKNERIRQYYNQNQKVMQMLKDEYMKERDIRKSITEFLEENKKINYRSYNVRARIH